MRPSIIDIIWMYCLQTPRNKGAKLALWFQGDLDLHIQIITGLIPAELWMTTTPMDVLEDGKVGYCSSDTIARGGSLHHLKTDAGVTLFHFNLSFFFVLNTSKLSPLFIFLEHPRQACSFDVPHKGSKIQDASFQTLAGVAAYCCCFFCQNSLTEGAKGS